MNHEEVAFDQSQKAILAQLPAELNSANWPRIKLQHLVLKEFCKHEYLSVDFTNNAQVMPMSILLGNNGIGKTTILNAIQYLFANFSAYDQERLDAMLLRNVRNWQNLKPEEMPAANFSIEGHFSINENPSEYKVQVTRQGVIAHHPQVIHERLTHYCMMARFDQELTTFQIRRDRWPTFQKLFGGVTGFSIEEDVSVFDQSSDRRASRLLQRYVMGFRIEKPEETITNKQCSAGEKKIAKCFSTILNKDVIPSIILIDNVTDHVEQSRHLKVLASIEECFPDSQLITTCHSYPVQKHYPNRQSLIDLRILHQSDLVNKEPWRLMAMDDVADVLEKLQNAKNLDALTHSRLEGAARILQGMLAVNPDQSCIKNTIAAFMKESMTALQAEWEICGSPKVTRIKPKEVLCPTT